MSLKKDYLSHKKPKKRAKKRPKKESCPVCGAKEWTLLEGEDVHHGYDGYPVTSCCKAV